MFALVPRHSQGLGLGLALALGLRLGLGLGSCADATVCTAAASMPILTERAAAASRVASMTPPKRARGSQSDGGVSTCGEG